MTTTTDYAPAAAAARRRACYFHAEALRAERAGRYADAATLRLHAAAARGTAARMAVTA
jgi:hypothetical protein